MKVPTQSTHRITNGSLPGYEVELGKPHPLELDCGVTLDSFTIAYQTYGKLNKEKSNAVLVCHALTGDQFAAENHPITSTWDILFKVKINPEKTEL